MALSILLAAVPIGAGSFAATPIPPVQNDFEFAPPREVVNKRVEIRAKVQGPGVLRAGFGVSDGSDPSKKRKWRPYFRNGDVRAERAGSVFLVLPLTAATKKKLKQGKVGGSGASDKTCFGIAFTPDFGPEVGQAACVVITA